MQSLPKKLEIRFVCPLPNGLHARPASRFEQIASGFTSSVVVENLSNSKLANAKSILSLVGADIKRGDECILRIEGADQEIANREIVRFLEEELPKCDEPLTQTENIQQESFISPVLEASSAKCVKGTPVVSGFGRGTVVFLRSLLNTENFNDDTDVAIDDRQGTVESAISNYRSELIARLDTPRLSTLEAQIAKAHLSIANDVELIEKINTYIKEESLTAGKAISKAYEYFANILKAAESQLIRERVADLKDVCTGLIAAIYGKTTHTQINLTAPSICIADDLSPSEFINIDKSLLKGVVLNQIGPTSHTVILARSFGIPILTGITDVELLLTAGQEVIVDANSGLLITEINDNVERFYNAENKKLQIRQQKLNNYINQPAKTQDGKRLEVMANVSTADEIKTAIDNGAEGVGLFRTEILFLGRNKAPTEDQQYNEYKNAAVYADHRPVIIRTFDIGADKQVDYINEEPDENPVLGYRGVRIYKQYESLLRAQLRAILRASAHGNLKIMVPMVSCRQEVVYVRQILEEVKSELTASSIEFNNDIELGIMVEVPSVCFVIHQLADIVDFLSIGSNDLTQYFMAVDRCNAKVSSLYQSHHPGLLGLIKKTVDDAHACGLWVGICGEIAGQIKSLPLLLGAGVDEVSVSIPSVTNIKAACSELASDVCVEVFNEVAKVSTSDQVDDILLKYSNLKKTSPIIEPNLVGIDLDCRNKAEVIKHVADTLWLAERTTDSIKLEKDFWLREQVYSTGLGHGFAVPHCKSTHIDANSICVFRLKEPIEWEAIDDKPVRVVIAMAIPDSQNSGQVHMEIFSRLARKIVHQEFRDELLAINDCQKVVDFLNVILELV